MSQGRPSLVQLLLTVSIVSSGYSGRTPSLAATLLEENFESLSSSLQPALDEAITPLVLGWTHTPPSGWSIDNSAMGPEGVREWQGWSFATMDFWTRTNTGQQRDAFTLAGNIVAVADPDEWDDRNSPSAAGTFNSTLISPSVPIPANTSTYLSFDSHYLQESPQEAKITVAFDGGPEQILLHYSSDPSSDNGGNHAANRRVQLAVPSQPSAANAVFRWTVHNARNNWYWAIDNILLSDTGPTPTPTSTGTRTATPTPTFDPNQPTPTPLPSGLVGRWLFDSGHVSGGIVEDLAGDLDGTIVSSLGLQASPPAIVLDGQDDWISLAVKGSPIALPPETLTAEAWVALSTSATACPAVEAGLTNTGTPAKPPPARMNFSPARPGRRLKFSGSGVPDRMQ